MKSVALLATIVAYSEKSEVEKNIGITEAFTGIGFLIGPLFGSFMFSIGSYPAIYGTMAILFAIFYPLVFVNLKHARNLRIEKEIETSRS